MDIIGNTSLIDAHCIYYVQMEYNNSAINNNKLIILTIIINHS